MYKNEYQGGPSVEIFSATGKDPLKNVKCSSGKRVYEKDVKGFILVLEGSTTTARLQFPVSDSKQHLGLIQRYLVMQVYVPLTKDFAVGLTMSDINNSKRRVVVSSSVKDISSTPLHAKLPLSILKRDVWANLCFDLVSLTSDLFHSQTFKSLEAFTISGTCKVRRVFTMKVQPFDTTNVNNVNSYVNQPCETIPVSLQFSNSVNFVTQVISVENVQRHHGIKTSRETTRETSGYWSSSSDDLNSSRRMSARDREQPQTHIAFGTKVQVDALRSARNKNGSNSARSERLQWAKSSDISTNRSFVRKTHSSKARLANAAEGNEHAIDKEDSIPNKKTKHLHSSSSPLANGNLPDMPSSLLNLVDDLDNYDDVEHSRGDNFESSKSSVVQLTGDSNVFKFSSQPHSVPRIRTVSSGSKASQENTDTLNGVSSDSEEDNEMERIQRRIIQNMPSPSAGRKYTVSPISKQSTLAKALQNHPFKPQSSLSPDISRMHSPPAHLYDSSKYSDSRINSQKPPLSKSIKSLKSSDATLTESVDTLIHSSLRDSAEDLKETEKNIELNDSSTQLSVSQGVQNLLGSQPSVTLNRKSVRELPPRNKSTELPPSSSFQVGTWSESFEAQMLASMKRGIEEDMNEQEEDDTRDDIDYQAQFEDSFDTSWSTYKNPPPMLPQAYDSEMKVNHPISSDTLNGHTMLSQSNPREWANLLSPPTVLPSVRAQQKKESVSDAESVGNEFDVMTLSDGSSSLSIKSSTTGDTDEEEMLDLLYDPCLNCYFDPKSGKYYELK